MTGTPLRRTRNDLIATAVISTVSVLAVGTVWLTAPIRGSELTSAPEPFVASIALTSVPASLDETWRAPDTTPGNHMPSITGGVIIGADGNTLHGYSPDGDMLWTYERDVELCTMAPAFDAAIATYRTGMGCGDAISISVSSGQYKATRSAIASDEVAPLLSNDRVGTVGTERVELWRSDLVRTVEYGEVDAKQEADQQPHPQCTISSAMTRKDLLAVTETCPDGSTFLRLQPTTPEDSRAPEVAQNIRIDAPDARLVAIGEQAAAVYVDDPAPTIISFNKEGETLHSQMVEEAIWPDAPHNAATADLPHHMSWFDGERLTLFSPDRLAVGPILEDALGTGIAIDGQLLYPVIDGIAVADWDTGETLRTIPVDRADYSGEVSLGLAGGAIVEKRGSELVGLA